MTRRTASPVRHRRPAAAALGLGSGSAAGEQPDDASRIFWPSRSKSRSTAIATPSSTSAISEQDVLCADIVVPELQPLRRRARSRTCFARGVNGICRGRRGSSPEPTRRTTCRASPLERHVKRRESPSGQTVLVAQEPEQKRLRPDVAGVAARAPPPGRATTAWRARSVNRSNTPTGSHHRAGAANRAADGELQPVADASGGSLRPSGARSPRGRRARRCRARREPLSGRLARQRDPHVVDLDLGASVVQRERARRHQQPAQQAARDRPGSRSNAQTGPRDRPREQAVAPCRHPGRVRRTTLASVCADSSHSCVRMRIAMLSRLASDPEHEVLRARRRCCRATALRAARARAPSSPAG